jgi:hypothetical protein
VGRSLGFKSCHPDGARTRSAVDRGEWQRLSDRGARLVKAFWQMRDQFLSHSLSRMATPELGHLSTHPND